VRSMGDAVGPADAPELLSGTLASAAIAQTHTTTSGILIAMASPP